MKRLSSLTYTGGRVSRMLVEMGRHRRRGHQAVHDDHSRMASKDSSDGDQERDREKTWREKT
jgi:hypothetical protein